VGVVVDDELHPLNANNNAIAEMNAKRFMTLLLSCG
jgi:hypothetical protein